MRFLFLEPFYGGSHRDFANGLAEASRHEIEILSLPARFWKWRMHGAALEFFRRLPDTGRFDGIMATNMMSLSDFKALAGKKCPPVLVYFHENQLSYPAPTGTRPDYHYPFTDITTALAADRVLFNSANHMEEFFGRLPGFIKMMPDFRPTWAVENIHGKTGVCRPGCRFAAEPLDLEPPGQGPPLIIWNHRWEHDKNPEAFFRALYALADRGIDFRAAVMGQVFKKRPGVFDEAARRLEGRIIQFGWVKSKSEYIKLLKQGTVAVNTAFQENFGIAAVEAARFGCIPLAPQRLSYPEIIPQQFHGTLLYDTEEELVEKLADILMQPGAYDTIRPELAEAMAEFSWENRIGDFDAELEALPDR